MSDVHQPGLAENLRANPHIVKEVEEVVLRTGPGVHPAVLCDHQMEVLRDQTLSRCQACPQSLDGDRVQRDGEWATPEHDSAAVQIDIAGQQVPELIRTGAVQEAEQPGGSFVGVYVGSCPAFLATSAAQSGATPGH